MVQNWSPGQIVLLNFDPQSDSEREWLVQHYEENRHSPITSDHQQRSAKYLLQSQAFDVFLAKKFGSVKRYGAEGAESMFVFFDEMLTSCGGRGVRDIVLAMPHRGRLNLLTGLLGLPTEALFHKVSWLTGSSAGTVDYLYVSYHIQLQGNAEFVAGAPSTGDVISHLGRSLCT